MYIGIDVGGTNIKSGVIDEFGNIIEQDSILTPLANPQLCIEEIFNIVKIKLLKYSDAKSVGIGVPGVVTDEGVVVLAPNLPNWNNIPLKQILNDKMQSLNLVNQIPLVIDNDANAAALAELVFGAGIGLEHFLYITLGTGIGGGIIINKKIFRGINGAAGEIGHIIIDCHEKISSKKMPYRTGILEEFAGRNQILTLAKSYLINNPDSYLNKLENFDVEDISNAVDRDDKTAKEIFKQVAEYMGIGMLSALTLLGINTVIIGGGISKSHQLLFDCILKVMKERALPHLSDNIDLRLARFTNDAGVIGSAMLGRY